MKKRDFPVHDVRRYLEPGPIVLVSSKWRGRTNIMTLGWHTILEFSPSLVGLMISSGNHSHDMIRRSKECVINLPTTALIDTVVGIGNCSGSEVDKFDGQEQLDLIGEALFAPRKLDGPGVNRLDCLHQRCRSDDADFVRLRSSGHYLETERRVIAAGVDGDWQLALDFAVEG